MQVTLDLVALRTKQAPLYTQYKGQNEPQGAYIELDCDDSTVTADYNGEIGNAIPFSVYHGRCRRYGVPADISGEGLANFLQSETFIALASRIFAGYESHWDGNNQVGRLNQDGAAAEEALEQLIEGALEDCRTEVWSAEAWLFDGNSLANVWGNGSVEEAAAELAAEARQNDVYLSSDLQEALLDQAQHLFKYGRDLLCCHVDALLADGRITKDQATEWREEQAQS